MKIMILGVGNAQIDAVEYCKEKGIYVYGCSYTNTEKGIPLLDHFEQINIIDAQAVKEYVKNENIDVVYSVGSDLAMPTACLVSEQLNLPHFVSHETAQICNMKHMMRDALGHNFEGNVKYVVAERKEDLKQVDFYPAMLKPVDSQGQRGVHRLDCAADAEKYFDDALSYSKSGRVIIEQFLDGQEISINGYMVNGEMAFGLVSERISFTDLPGGIIKEHYLPSLQTPEVQEKAKDLAKRVANKLNINNGPVYYQIKVVNETPYLIEVTPRLDGCHMWRLIKHCTGVDLLDAAFTHLLTGEIDLSRFEYSEIKDKWMLAFMCQAPGTEVKTYDVGEAEYVRWYYEDGDTVRKLNGYMEKCGYRIVRN